MGSCAAPSAKGDDKFITTDYLQQCPRIYLRVMSFSEDDCTEYQESAALVDCSAVYRAVLLTLSRVAASRTLSPLAMCSRGHCCK
ncbi:hypothetical protein, partial [Escherichia coli]|uniref:hypothetical protein n=1 Tax=Escherichia coli TaxID=562 RepID=UPI003CCC81FB